MWRQTVLGQYGTFELLFGASSSRSVASLVAIRRRFRHHAWAGARLIEALETTSAPDALRPFAHALAADQIWHRRLTGGPQADLAIWPALDAAGCRVLYTETTADWRRLLEGPFDLEAAVAYQNSRGAVFENRVGDVLDHVLMHAAHHRGQANVALRTAGAVPPALDFIVWVREGEPEP